MTGVVLGVLAIVASLIIALFWVVPSMRFTSAESHNHAQRSGLVVAAPQAPVRGQQLELRMCGDQTFGRVQDVDGMAAVAGHHRHTDTRSAVQVARTGLGG